MDTIHTSMRQALELCQPNYSLPRAFYTSPDFFRLDMEQIFYQHWLFVAHECELPELGDYLSYGIGDYSIIIQRQTDGSLKAFHNTCRHRGARLCQQQQGNHTNFVCLYHQWTYDLSGKLIFAKDMGEHFNSEQHDLLPVHCESLAGNIYICLAKDAPDFQVFRQVVEPYLLPHHLHEAKVAYESNIIEEGNWKLVLENNRECYHCLGSHPELCRTYSDDPNLTGVKGGIAPLISQHWEKCTQLGLPSVFHLSEQGEYRVARMPLIGAGESFTMSGLAASQKPMVSVDERKLGTVLLFHYPNTWNHFLSDHAITFRVTPIDATHTRVTTKWLVHKDAVEGVDYDLKTLTEVWLATNDQDRIIVEENQKGINSPAYRPGPYSLIHEDGVIQFIDWYCRATKQALDPQTMTKNYVDQPASCSQTVATTNHQALPTAPLLQTDSSQPTELEVINIIQETPDVKTYCFRPIPDQEVKYSPGQFMTFELPINGQSIFRTYTLSSSPTHSLNVAITVKAQANGYASRWLYDSLTIGRQLRAFGPRGEFHLHNYPADKYCFISAGSGITPMMSMTRYLADDDNALDISFIHCARSPQDLIFRDELEHLSARLEGLKLAWIVEKFDPPNTWSGYHGWINQSLLQLSTPDYLERELFCCGPEPFMQAVREILHTSGFNMAHYHEESFQTAPLPNSSPTSTETIPVLGSAVLVNFEVSGKSISAHQNMTVLQASLNAGLNIPSACHRGLCGTCKVKNLSGEVDMQHSGGISNKDIEEGYILACCSKPLSDLIILY